ncbi:MAG: hypothetical protein V2I32_13360, partial [Desulforhopalus sp.]|nr:hypothetical protein [Desulforhopalus sp.]
MFAQLEKLYRIVDDTVTSITAAHPRAVRCRPGCADCCHAVFDISFIEAARLALFLAENPLTLTSQQKR